jgi:hypothetical protein
VSKTAFLLAVVAASSLSPALAMPLSSDRAVSSTGGSAQVGPRRPGQVVAPGLVQRDSAMGPKRPGIGNSAVDPSYLADR